MVKISDGEFSWGKSNLRIIDDEPLDSAIYHMHCAYGPSIIRPSNILSLYKYIYYIY